VRSPRVNALARLATLALAAVLLVAWQAALQHPIEHVDELGELVHLHDSEEKNPEAGPLCDLLASLTACAPGTPLLALGAERVASLPTPQNTGAPRAADAPPFLSQGPPASV
jgi:hypothetical protein